MTNYESVALRALEGATLSISALEARRVVKKIARALRHVALEARIAEAISRARSDVPFLAAEIGGCKMSRSRHQGAERATPGPWEYKAELITQKAQLELDEFVTALSVRHDLTYGEFFAIMSQALANWAKWFGKRERQKMALESAAAAARPYMKKITKYEEDRTEHSWVFTLECGHTVVSPVGPGVFTTQGVMCSECLKAACEPLSITCPKCKRKSCNVRDVRLGYCGYCHQFHADMR